jgi:hypothetical protein
LYNRLKRSQTRNSAGESYAQGIEWKSFFACGQAKKIGTDSPVLPRSGRMRPNFKTKSAGATGSYKAAVKTGVLEKPLF